MYFVSRMLCGGGSIGKISSTSNHMFLLFESNFDVERPGFNISYTTRRANTGRTLGFILANKIFSVALRYM